MSFQHADEIFKAMSNAGSGSTRVSGGKRLSSVPGTPSPSSGVTAMTTSQALFARVEAGKVGSSFEDSSVAKVACAALSYNFQVFVMLVAASMLVSVSLAAGLVVPASSSGFPWPA